MNNKEQIQQLIYDYATFADSRETQAQFELFDTNGGMSVYYPWNNGVAEEITTSEQLLDTFLALKQYETTFHFIGQVSIDLEDEQATTATAYVYTIAHHVIVAEDGSKSLMIAYLRYKDTLIKTNNTWKFKHRALYADVIENRVLK
ncbi:nuclear transport factor 2 family protein [Lactococcus protaetiae]|uniref:Nuclear transport factor 2 family protein n=1 Tax=Lactococcus protaetiae TaxID=2592653 RepID=A0A514Z7G3_9LACT|nr:nuclear transport factor 2 family protein [Lactococcus protaetiae]QDK70538.1 nuclear transport factor 2 family protein [Lactococcus protaetiae]